jgi:hypothetical protein
VQCRGSLRQRGIYDFIDRLVADVELTNELQKEAWDEYKESVKAYAMKERGTIDCPHCNKPTDPKTKHCCQCGKMVNEALELLKEQNGPQ